MKIIAGFLLMLVAISSCGPSQRSLFGEKKTPHEKYSDKIKNAGLDVTEMGKLWFTAANRAMEFPQQIKLPFKQSDSFSAITPGASGYLIEGKRGGVINIYIITDSINHNGFFVELWEPVQQNTKTKLLAAADSTLIIKYEIEKDGPLIIRIQPELLLSIKYTLEVRVSPSIGFPVSQSGNPKIISFWSDPRDRGARSHEGIDISAKFRTPAIAAADGHIQSVTTNNLGGNVVFMRPRQKDYVLYYAHLDTQLVTTGQQVKMGDILGLVGNTGNAKGTIPHLHFGIYGPGGAIDPLPFISPGTVRR